MASPKKAFRPFLSLDNLGCDDCDHWDAAYLACRLHNGFMDETCLGFTLQGLVVFGGRTRRRILAAIWELAQQYGALPEWRKGEFVRTTSKIVRADKACLLIRVLCERMEVLGNQRKGG